MNKALLHTVFSISFTFLLISELHSQHTTVEQITNNESIRIINEVKSNISKMGLKTLQNKSHTLFSSPVKVKADIRYYENLYFSSFVDHNPVYDSLLDYNCGNRTYDKTTGGHQGTDFTIRPFKWTLMQNETAEVVAAATGIIVYYEDGHYDMNCTAPDSTSNTVVLWHPSDGSTAAYVHLKKYSLTTKQPGDTVYAGEHIGFIGSSGISSGPHLHFEVRDSNNNLIDPFEGPCNNLNADSWWINQFPYHDQTIMSLTTHEKKIDEGNGCNDIEILYYKDQFFPGDSIYVYAYIRSFSPGDTFSLKIVRSDGSTFYTSANISVSSFYSTYRMYRLRYIASGEPTGIWYIEALLKSPYITGGSTTKRKYFCVGQNPEPIASFNISGSGQNISLINTSSNANTYLWDFGDGIYSMLESPSHTYQPSGNYKICLTASNGCDQDTSCLWFSTGVHPKNTAHDFIIFPNPANEYISIKLSEKETGTILIRLLDIYGRAVTEIFEIPAGQDEFTLSTTHIKAGVYLVEINIRSKKYYKKMIIH